MSQRENSDPNYGKTVTFEAKQSGDCECFVWGDVSEEDVVKVTGEEMSEAFLPNTLYPGDICRALEMEDDTKYRITITAEPIDLSLIEDREHDEGDLINQEIDEWLDDAIAALRARWPSSTTVALGFIAHRAKRRYAACFPQN